MMYISLFCIMAQTRKRSWSSITKPAEQATNKAAVGTLEAGTLEADGRQAVDKQAADRQEADRQEAGGKQGAGMLVRRTMA